jgi:hypothetical protein
MITVEDCRRKAAEGLDKAQVAADPKTIASMQRASDAWTALARQIEEAALRRPQFRAHLRRPVDLAKSYASENVQIGDVLRGRLRLSDDAENSSE